MKELLIIGGSDAEDWKNLAHRTAAGIESEGVELLLEHRAGAIDAANKKVSMVTRSGDTMSLPYDRLVIATGATSARPPIRGLANALRQAQGI